MSVLQKKEVGRRVKYKDTRYKKQKRKEKTVNNQTCVRMCVCVCKVNEGKKREEM